MSKYYNLGGWYRSWHCINLGKWKLTTNQELCWSILRTCEHSLKGMPSRSAVSMKLLWQIPWVSHWTHEYLRSKRILKYLNCVILQKNDFYHNLYIYPYEDWRVLLVLDIKGWMVFVKATHMSREPFSQCYFFLLFCLMSESVKIPVQKEALRYGMTASIHSILKIKKHFL